MSPNCPLYKVKQYFLLLKKKLFPKRRRNEGKEMTYYMGQSIRCRSFRTINTTSFIEQ